jgi:hypothetical protein
MYKSVLAAAMLLSSVSLAVHASDAPSIGGSATITANVSQGGIINAGAGAGGFQGTVKQAVASVIHGSIAGALATTVNVTQGGIINFGGGASAAKVTACQSVGTVGSDCDN